MVRYIRWPGDASGRKLSRHDAEGVGEALVQILSDPAVLESADAQLQPDRRRDAGSQCERVTCPVGIAAKEMCRRRSSAVDAKGCDRVREDVVLRPGLGLR